jgi:hypothetical protein
MKRQAHITIVRARGKNIDYFQVRASDPKTGEVIFDAEVSIAGFADMMSGSLAANLATINIPKEPTT